MKYEHLPEEYREWLDCETIDTEGEVIVTKRQAEYMIRNLLDAGWIPPLSPEPIEVEVRLEHVKHGDGEIEHYRMYCDESLAHDKLVDIFFPWHDKEFIDLRMKDALVFVVHHTAESITLKKVWVDNASDDS